MKTRAPLLVCEALVLGGPTTAALVYGFPVITAGSIATLVQSPGVGAVALLSLCGAVWSLAEFWRLASRTAQSQVYVFGLRFWSAIGGALLGAFTLVGIPVIADALLVIPPAICMAHFIYLQIRDMKGAHAA